MSAPIVSASITTFPLVLSSSRVAPVRRLGGPGSRRPRLPLSSSSSLAAARGRGQAKPCRCRRRRGLGALKLVRSWRRPAPSGWSVRPDVTVVAGGAPANPIPHGRRLQDLGRHDRQGRRRRDQIGGGAAGSGPMHELGLQVTVGTMASATRRLLDGSAGFHLCLVLDNPVNFRGNPRSPCGRTMAVLLRRSPSSGHVWSLLWSKEPARPAAYARWRNCR